MDLATHLVPEKISTIKDKIKKSKGDKIKGNVINQNYGNRGLRIIEIASLIKPVSPFG